MAATYSGPIPQVFIQTHGLRQTGPEAFTKVFTGQSDREVYEQMDAMKARVAAVGGAEVRRTKIGRNTPCPCA